MITSPSEAQSLRDAVELAVVKAAVAGRGNVLTVGEIVREIVAPIGVHIAKIEADKEAAEAQSEALHAKLAALAPHGSCACSYDTPGDVCAHHSPQVATLTARLAEVEAALEPFAKFAEVYDCWDDPGNEDLKVTTEHAQYDESHTVTLRQLRAARSALSNKESGHE